MSNRQRSFGESRRRGWGMGLYRNRSEGWIGGVCAGLAAHWDVPNWVVRLAAVALLMFTGSLAFWLYVIAWVAIAPKASRWSELPEEEVEIEMEYDEDRHAFRRKTVFRYTDAPAERVLPSFPALVTMPHATPRTLCSRSLFCAPCTSPVPASTPSAARP